MKLFSITLFVGILIGGIWFIRMNSQRGVATLPVVTPTPTHQSGAEVMQEKESEHMMMVESDKQQDDVSESKMIESVQQQQESQQQAEPEQLEIPEFEPQNFESIQVVP